MFHCEYFGRNKIIVHSSISNFSHVYFALEIGLKAIFVSILYRLFLREICYLIIFLLNIAANLKEIVSRIVAIVVLRIEYLSIKINANIFFFVLYNYFLQIIDLQIKFLFFL